MGKKNLFMEHITMGASPSEPPYLRDLMQHEKNDPYSAFVTLATVEGGKPRARTLLHQGTDRCGRLLVKANERSNKIKNRDSDLVELVWWFERASAQFRFSGTIEW